MDEGPEILRHNDLLSKSPDDALNLSWGRQSFTNSATKRRRTLPQRREVKANAQLRSGLGGIRAARVAAAR
ncbi:hypothetical protein GCM10009557_34700 [Virgisporangium ochraceum]|uniref:Uncharacterized protein n=1 Tax=Virgisporangium ochraceum TaxID=65505 RepID=A0A8J4EAU2_9ACTN|nr:hypothetical protein Voc01_029530 [Virgisporangium ochraceum]